MPPAAVVSALARSMIAGDPDAADVQARAAHTLGQSWRWLQPFARRYVAAFAGRPRPRHRDVVQFILADDGFQSACRYHRDRISVAHWLPEPPRMQPVNAAMEWDLPAIDTVADLARWFSVHLNHLEWFADLKGLCSKIPSDQLHHYRYRIQPKRSGGVRLIESPKPELKAMQRRILSLILDRIPAHPAVHGFVKGRSVVTFAAPHVGRDVLLRLDLENFFPAFPAARAQAIFRTLGYPEPVADRLGAICSNAVPASAFAHRPPEVGPQDWWAARKLYARPHLPQGAPTSPSLANATAFRLDCRLSGLAKSAGAVYTRYADDLAFSGNADFARVVERFASHAAAVALEEGFDVNHRKTRIMRQGVRQSLAGIVVNRGINLHRRDLEVLEATLTNCARFGPASQNRRNIPDFRAHLEGRIGYVEMVNRAKGLRLRALFNAVRFS